MFKLYQLSKLFRRFSTKSKNGIVQFLPGDLTSTTSFKGEIYPLVVIENLIADEQKLTTLMSSSGRISYTSSNFLRFWQPGFIEDATIFESKDRLQGKMKTFSREMMKIFTEKESIFREATNSILKEKGFLYEEDLFNEIFTGKIRNEFVEASFAVHKFLFESQQDDWIKDGQWNLSENSVGPYILRPKWQQDLIFETREAILQGNDLETFRIKVKNALNSNVKFKIESKLDELIFKCLKALADEFYVNFAMIKNPFKNLITEAFLGVAIIDTQSQAKAIFMKLFGEPRGFEASKPLLNSFVNEVDLIKELIIDDKTDNNTIHNIDTSTNLKFHDFGDIPVYLIDPIGTIEVDDGISVEQTGDGKVILHVHVADPSDFVFGSIEEEAKRRAETIYIPERKISMLPERITNLSTLKVGGIKTLTFSCRIDMQNGQIYDHQIRRGVINNLKHFTYEEADIIDNDSNLELLKKLTEAHLKYRDSNGHLNFTFPRGMAQLDFENEKILINLDDDGVKMKKIVAEAMIIAGRIAGEYLRERGIPGPFRNHSDEVVVSDNMNLLQKYEVLKNLSSASVDSVAKRHASMGLDAYIKVTSPLRRYLDLVTHSILKTEKNSRYGNEWFNANLQTIHRQELYNKRLSASVNRYWIERFIWQQERSNYDQQWTLIPLEKLKEGMWTVHIEEVATNFMVQLASDKRRIELGEGIKSRLIGKPHESLLRFERVQNKV